MVVIGATVTVSRCGRTSSRVRDRSRASLVERGDIDRTHQASAEGKRTTCSTSPASSGSGPVRARICASREATTRRRSRSRALLTTAARLRSRQNRQPRQRSQRAHLEGVPLSACSYQHGSGLGSVKVDDDAPDGGGPIRSQAIRCAPLTRERLLRTGPGDVCVGRLQKLHQLFAHLGGVLVPVNRRSVSAATWITSSSSPMITERAVRLAREAATDEPSCGT